MSSDSVAAPYTNHLGAATNLLVRGETTRIFMAFPHVWLYPTIFGTKNSIGKLAVFLFFPQRYLLLQDLTLIHFYI